jgi:aminoglycoside phosphotransferase (APT) family kinase protein
LPTNECPLPWLVLRWIRGVNPIPWDLEQPELLALDLASFLAALAAVSTDGAPKSWRGNLPLGFYDADVRRSIDYLDDEVAAAAREAWNAALELPAPTAPPVWLHGDLWSGNLVVEDGHLMGVVDWSSSGVGDQMRDLIVPWESLPAGPRARLREALAVDDATWARGRAQAMATAIIDIAHYDSLDPRIAQSGRFTLDQVLADLGLGRG